MEDLLKKFEEESPEVVFEWQDKKTDAKGWIVMNSNFFNKSSISYC